MVLTLSGGTFSSKPLPWQYAPENGLSDGTSGLVEKVPPERARSIWKSVYYIKMVCIMNFMQIYQFSQNQKMA